MAPRAPYVFLRACVVAACAAAMASCGGGDGNGNSAGLIPPISTQAAASELVDAYAATLDGTAETPSTGSTAQGAATVVLDALTRQALVTVTTSGIDATRVDIRQGAPGTTGAVLVMLTETAEGSGAWSALTAFTQEQVDALQTGNLYVEAASAAFPSGEIRGQIAPQQSAGATGSSTAPLAIAGNGLILPATPSATTFVSSLKGAQQVPPVSSAGRAAGTVTVNPLTRQLVAAVKTFGVQSTGVQIREGAAGVSGPVVLALTDVPAGSGNWFGRGALTEAQYNLLVDGGMYFNVASAAFPAGELRGQLLPQSRFVSGPLPSTGGASIGIGTISPVPLIPDNGAVTPSGIDSGTGIGTGIGTGVVGMTPTSTGIGSGAAISFGSATLTPATE